MTFIDRYSQSKTWHEKVLVMGLYHIAQLNRNCNDWTILDTAKYFNVSTGLVSENLKLHRAIDNDIRLTEYTREIALRKIKQ